MRILSVVGTRPEVIKMAMVARRLAAAENIDHLLCVTGQHREMQDAPLALFGLVADFDLGIMTRDQCLTQVATRVLDGLRAVFAEAAPDRVLVQGDTTTALGAAMAAHYTGIPVGHVEAGLRTHDLSAPWPEEFNRRVIDLIADRHYAPTERARNNLLAEGLPHAGITVTGNTGIDALRFIAGRLNSEPELADQAGAVLPERHSGNRWILVTAHRRESFGAPIERVCGALAQLARHGGLEILFPVHPNPNVHAPVHRLLGGVPQVRLLPPLDYLPFVHLMTQAQLIITDSGGVQEEAASLGKPALVIRDVTDRPEAVDAGSATVVGTDAARIVGEAIRLLSGPQPDVGMVSVDAPYGDGRASIRILENLQGEAVR